MIAPPQAQKHFGSAKKRFLQSSIERFFDREFPRTFGPVIRQKMAEKIVELVEHQLPHKEYLRPGQCVWNAVSVSTRPDRPDCQLVPVILTLVSPEDVDRLARGTRMSQIARDVVARLSREAHAQGGLLSMRDIGLLTGRGNAAVTDMRKRWEKENDTVLPHPGSLQDFGTTLTHKTMIVRKVIYERKDPRRVGDETKHSQRAVDRYLKDFHRVRTCYRSNPDLSFITQTTGLSAHLVNQYLQMIRENEERA